MTTPDLSSLPPLREVIAAHGLMAKKSLGQNFLLDLNITARIVRQAGNLSGVNVIEIGPGPGGLTRPLVESTANSITAIERDDRCVAALAPLVEAAQGRLNVIPEDALKVDLTTLAAAQRAIVANLPYNIDTPLLVSWLKQIDQLHSLTLMFQKEVAERLAAATRSPDYGRLSVLVQWLCHVDKCFDLPPSAFTPPPKVTSSVVHLRPRADTDLSLFPYVEKITAAAFGQRRKMLRQSLKTIGGLDVLAFLADCAITETARAEEIDIDGFLRMAKRLEQLNR